MASEVVREELDCSICHDLYTEPVTLRCGHSFCLACINNCWDSQGAREKEYSCPECRDTSMRRPEVTRNLRLCNIVKCLHSNQTEKQVTGIVCTYCIYYQVPAVKTCLLCEASLCHTHLGVHNKSEEHVLTEPTTSFENRKCSLHKKLLEYYCSEDGTCICMSCCIAKEHQGHQVEPLKEAWERRVKKLRHLLERSASDQKMTETSIEKLKQQQDHKCSTNATEEVTGVFREIQEKQRTLENKILSEISGQEKKATLAFSDQITKLETRKDELSRKIGHIEELCNMDDPIKVLEESERDEFCSSEEGEAETLADDMDHVLISGSLLTALMDVVMDLKEKTEICVQKASDLLLNGLASPMCSSGSTNTKRKGQSTICGDQQPDSGGPPVVVKSKQVAHFKMNYSDTVLPRLDSQQVSNIVLDEGTAATNVKLKYKNSFITWSEIQLREETAERFESGQVLSVTRFSSGQHYWDVETSESGYWRVGVAYPCIQRKGQAFCIGDNKESWCLSMLCGNYSAVHDGKEKDLSRRHIQGNRFRIFVNYESGLLAFHHLKDSVRTIHTFTAQFTEPLHAAFWVSSGAWRPQLAAQWPSPCWSHLAAL
uniref:Uncharacterized protein n=1 Tax=Xenopus tropicalis TaxID=8364 RepID=A0A803K6H8_XENTR